MKLYIGNLKFGEMEFGEMKRNTSNWSNFCILLRLAGSSASAGLSCMLQCITLNWPLNGCGFLLLLGVVFLWLSLNLDMKLI